MRTMYTGTAFMKSYEMSNLLHSCGKLLQKLVYIVRLQQYVWTLLGI